ncbi:AraC family transcriptional regulator [Belliella kenyensis]|uniref:AraC family transcriptional regulator n=1 Tax=Belliella kenyensis TaxID=1472724 RepID=A0ABV8EIC0_9BACT|nr:AraC family transcriptional regulator [Belliella kenyensis]MCH7401315.1 AraC family transcriptional regulator [Belliella kenyensis]MDN3602759.1 AraC family transcriptional regulator [Belliella kenyensis]
MARKIISFQIPKSNKEFVRFQIDSRKHFYEKLHQHPQWQLTLVVEGKGQLMVGDYLGRFGPGDMFLFASNMPHVFRSDAAYFEESNEKLSISYTLFFDFEVFGPSLLELDELSELGKWVSQVKGSYKVLNETKEILGEEMLHFKGVKGLEKLLRALKILKLLKDSPNLTNLNQYISERDYTETEGKRMGKVMNYILTKSHTGIELSEVADMAHLSKEAFCRFFKDRTGKTFTAFLSQVRVHQASQLLMESDLSIAQIAYQSGFQNLSYFNRVFKRIQGESPKEYRLRRLSNLVD